MPTIEQLQRAVVSADDDLVPVSQGGTVRAVTRAQLLSGLQPTLSITPGLLGRSSGGVGPVEQLAVGAGLTLAGGVLAAAPTFSTAKLSNVTKLGPTDLVPIASGGVDRSITVATLVGQSGADASLLSAQGAVGRARPIASWLSDCVAIEAFGAVGDGSTDDTAAFVLGAASGRPIRLGPKLYRVDGQWTITNSITLIGDPGLSTLRRVAQAGGAWICATGTEFRAWGVTFDAGSVTVDSWGVQISSTCRVVEIESCAFRNARGPTLGVGLLIEARDGQDNSIGNWRIRASEFTGNAQHGLWIQAAHGALVQSCLATNNGGYGICVDFTDPTFSQAGRFCSIMGNVCSGNARGISLGNYNATNAQPPTWGLANPDFTDALVSGNHCIANTAYGIAVSGSRIAVLGNQVEVGPSVSSSGILANASLSTLAHNVISGAGAFGIDAGGSANCDIASNNVSGMDVAINAGGSVNIRVRGNLLSGNRRAVTAFLVETDGQGNAFGLACSQLSIEENAISMDDSLAAGIDLYDGVRKASVRRNSFYAAESAHPMQALSALTDEVVVEGNSWNGSSVGDVDIATSALQTEILYPEIFDRIRLPSQITAVSTLEGQFAKAVSGQVTFVRVTAGGSGYTSATVAISGTGTGAAAMAYVAAGSVIGIAMIAPGQGYSPGSTVVTINGDGSGAMALACVGLPVASDQKFVTLCEGATTFQFGSGGNLTSGWAESTRISPAGTACEWVGLNGTWSVCHFSAAPYVLPTATGVTLDGGDGDVIVRTKHRRVRLCSEDEPTGFASLLGRGSPAGVVAAPPGSDYRNLDGGVGATLWVKCAGVDASGWVAIA